MTRARRGPGGRRTSGFQSLDLPGALGSLLRTALEQVGVVREVVERQARSSRVRFDSVLWQRKRRDALARLGEIVYELAADGHLGDLGDMPEIAEIVAEIEALEAGMTGSNERDGERDVGPDVVSSRDWTPPRAHGRGAAGETDARVWRPVMPQGRFDDGSEPRTSTRRGEPAGPRAAAHDEASEPEPGRDHQVPWSRVRNLDELAGQASDPGHGQRSPRRRGRSEQAAGPDHASRQGREPAPRASSPRGGIAFIEDPLSDPDDDLAAYMHDDDVPPRDDE